MLRLKLIHAKKRGHWALKVYAIAYLEWGSHSSCEDELQLPAPVYTTPEDNFLYFL